MKWFCSLLLFSLLAGCATSRPRAQVDPTTLPKTPQMEASFQPAEALFYAKEFSKAQSVYEKYLDQFSPNAYTQKACFRLGEIALHDNYLKKALQYYQKSVERYLDPEWGPLSLYKQAIVYSRMRNPAKALSVLDKLPPRIEFKLAIRAGSLRVAEARKMKDSLEENRGYLELAYGYELLPESEQKIGELNWIISKEKALEALKLWSQKVSEEDRKGVVLLKKWLPYFQETSASGGTLFWKMGQILHARGEESEAAKWLRDYLLSYPKHSFGIEAQRLLKEMDQKGSGVESRPVVGVLLPLTGIFSVYGESALHGIECAAGIFSPCGSGDLGVTLLIKDTQGDPKEVSRQLEELSAQPEVKMIIGPLAQVEVDAAAASADRLGVPMVVLSQKPDIAKRGAYVFRNFLTVSDQVETLVQYACEEKKWKRFAILTPQGSLGEEYRKVFEAALERCGQTLVASASFDPEHGDLTEALRSLKLTSAPQRVQDQSPFDVLFFPGVYRQVPELIEALKFLNLSGIHLLGAAGWDHPSLVKNGPEDLEGSIFVDGFFSQASPYATRNFVSSFESTYGVPPTLLEAYAYDTLRLVGDVLKDHPAASRIELQDALSKKKNFTGVTGTISFDDEGDAQRRLFLLTVEKGEIKEISKEISR